MNGLRLFEQQAKLIRFREVPSVPPQDSLLSLTHEDARESSPLRVVCARVSNLLPHAPQQLPSGRLNFDPAGLKLLGEALSILHKLESLDRESNEPVRLGAGTGRGS